MIQWHPSLTSGLMLIPQRLLNAYREESAAPNSTYQLGDFVVNAAGCNSDRARSCEQELRPYLQSP